MSNRPTYSTNSASLADSAVCALAVVQTREVERRSNPTPATIIVDNGRKRVLIDAPTVKRTTHVSVRAIGNRDAGARDLRAHDLRRANAKRRSARKRIIEARAELARRGYGIDGASRKQCERAFTLALQCGDVEAIAHTAAAWLLVATVGANRNDVRSRIVEAMAALCRAHGIHANTLDVVLSVARALRPYKRSVGASSVGICIDPTLASDLYAMVDGAKAVHLGIPLPSQLVTNGKRVGGTDAQRVWDARPLRSGVSKSRPLAPIIKSRNLPITLSEGGPGGLRAQTESDAGCSRSQRILTHVRTGDPTVSLGHVDLDDAARIVRLVERDRSTDRLTFSPIRQEVSRQAWSIAISALRHDGALSKFAADCKRLARAGKSNMAIAHKGCARIASVKIDSRTIATCATVAKAYAVARAPENRLACPVVRQCKSGAILVIATVDVRGWEHTHAVGCVRGTRNPIGVGSPQG